MAAPAGPVLKTQTAGFLLGLQRMVLHHHLDVVNLIRAPFGPLPKPYKISEFLSDTKVKCSELWGHAYQSKQGPCNLDRIAACGLTN